MKKFLRNGAGGVLLLALLQGTALAAPSLSQPGQDIRGQESMPEAEVRDDTPVTDKEGGEVQFTITNFRLEAPDLSLDKGPLVQILQDGMGEGRTLTDLNATIREITGYCRRHGYPAAAAYLPAQTSEDGVVVLKVIPGRYGEVKIDNHSRLKENVIKDFLVGLKKDKIIRTEELETVLYSLSDASGNKAVGVLEPGADFGSSDLTVRIEKGKGTNTILYVENYGSTNTGRYRYGVQHSIYDVGGNGGRINVGALISNRKLHNYYANYETLVGHGGTTLGIGISRMDYQVGGLLSALDANGTALTLSLFGQRPIYHLHDRMLTFKYGYDYRKLSDDIDAFNIDGEKHSHNVHVGLEGFRRVGGFALGFGGTLTLGHLTPDSEFTRSQTRYERTEGSYVKLEGNATAVQSLGHSTDVMVRGSMQLANHNLDGSEQMYLGGANGVRAYPQGTGSGDEGIMATAELRYHTPLQGLVASTYFDIGHVRYSHDGTLSGVVGGRPSSGMTLKGWGLGLAYTVPGDWFARLDYARRIGGDPNLSEEAKARGRLWFMLGKVW